MAHYGDQVKEGYDELSIDKSIDQEEEVEVEAESQGTPEPQPVSVRLQPEVMAPPVKTQTVQPLKERNLNLCQSLLRLLNWKAPQCTTRKRTKEKV